MIILIPCYQPDAKLLVMVDGDTVFETDAVRMIVQPFANRRVGAVSGSARFLPAWLGSGGVPSLFFMRDTSTINRSYLSVPV